MLTVRDYIGQITSDHRIALQIAGQQAARRSIELACRELNAGDLRAFVLLALMDTPRVSAAAAAAMLGLPVTPAEQILTRLARNRLLDGDGTGRYAMHDLVRGYAAEQAQATLQAAVRDAAVKRWLEWCLASASLADRMIESHRYRDPVNAEPAAQPLISLDTRQDALAWLDAERSNLAAAVLQAAECDPALAWRIAWAIFGYFLHRKPWAEWIDTYRTGLSCAVSVSEPQGEAVMSYGLGYAYYYPRRFAEALDSFHRTLNLFRETGDSRGEGIALNAIGNVYMETRRLDKALRFYTCALAIHRRGGHLRDKGVALNNLSEVNVTLGRYSEAERCARLGLDTQREVDNQRVEVFTMCHLGNARWRLGYEQDATYPHPRATALSGTSRCAAWPGWPTSGRFPHSPGY